VVSAGVKQRDRGQALTGWRAEDMVCQQVQNGGTKGRHSLPGEQKTWCVSKCRTERQRAGTHPLESRGCGVSAGTKQRDRGQALTIWRVEDTVCQQVQNGGTKGRHSQTASGNLHVACISLYKVVQGHTSLETTQSDKPETQVYF
jgi:hypothetical protein